MKLYKAEPFVHQDREYEIRTLYDDTRINVVAFLNNYPANGFRYQILLSKKSDVTKILDNNAANGLINHLKSDIEQKLWDNI